ncbi:MAG: hypothetical protein CMH98_03725 [Oceanospirillaceae bacterium]|nr:hypothetical protein [Oceanospirillaceae bacterium]
MNSKTTQGIVKLQHKAAEAQLPEGADPDDYLDRLPISLEFSVEWYGSDDDLELVRIGCSAGSYAPDVYAAKGSSGAYECDNTEAFSKHYGFDLKRALTEKILAGNYDLHFPGISPSLLPAIIHFGRACWGKDDRGHACIETDHAMYPALSELIKTTVRPALAADAHRVAESGESEFDIADSIARKIAFMARKAGLPVNLYYVAEDVCREILSEEVAEYKRLYCE